MLKKTGILMAIQLCFFFSSAQTKLNSALLRALHAQKDGAVTCLVKGEVEQIQRAMPSFLGRFNYSAKNIASVTLPLSKIKDFAAQTYVQRIELLRQNVRVLDDSALRKNKILQIHSGNPPLAQAYTGKGVLLGIIDTGTDIHHPDFKDSTGNTRIAYLWDQRFPLAANTPQPYNYGQEWSAAQINAGFCGHQDYVDAGHGTKVAGVAAGNGASAFQYRGVAPEVEIISVAIDFNNPGPTLTDAVSYIVNKANTLGKPLVINISLGDYFGSHDGKDLQAQLIDNLMGNQPGRAVVAAAGNAGQIPFHLGYTVNGTDTNFTWATNATSNIDFQMYGDSLNFKNIKFSVGANRNGSYSYIGNIGFQVVDSLLGVIHTDTLKVNGNRIGIVSSTADYSDSLYTLDVSITADSLNTFWSFQTCGSGKLDAWDFDFVHDNLPNVSQLPAIVKYIKPDTLQTICTSFQCSRNVISVGNYVDRTTFLDAADSIHLFDGTDNDLYFTSSLGPTRDGRIKPEITASGENVATTGALEFLAWLVQNYPFAATLDSLHMTFGGTSAAAPEVAGFAALYFQKYPTATVQQMKQDIIACSYQDLFTTTTLPNNSWGYGKLDGFAALTCRPEVTLSVKSNSLASSFLIYPNPASERIKISNAQVPCTIQLTDVLGKKMREIFLKDPEQDLVISNLVNGIYFIIVKTPDGRSATQRFIKND